MAKTSPFPDTCGTVSTICSVSCLQLPHVIRDASLFMQHCGIHPILPSLKPGFRETCRRLTLSNRAPFIVLPALPYGHLTLFVPPAPGHPGTDLQSLLYHVRSSVPGTLRAFHVLNDLSRVLLAWNSG